MFGFSPIKVSVFLTSLALGISTANAQEKTALALFSDTCLVQIESYEKLTENVKATGWKTASAEADPMLSIAVSNIRGPRTFTRGGQSITIQSRVLGTYKYDGENGPVFAVTNQMERGSNDAVNWCHVFDFDAKTAPKENDWDNATLIKTLSGGTAIQYLSMTFHLYADAQAAEATSARGLNLRITEHKKLKGMIMRTAGFSK